MPLFTNGFSKHADEEIDALLFARYSSSYPTEQYRVISKRDDFVIVGPRDKPDRIRYFVLHRGTVVAMLAAVLDTPYPRITLSFTKQRFRSMGLGYEMYMALIKDYGGAMSDMEVSPDAKEIWDKMKRTGMKVSVINDDDLRTQQRNHSKISPQTNDNAYETSQYGTRYIVSLGENLQEDSREDGKRFYRELIPHADNQIYSTPAWQPNITDWPLSRQELIQVEKEIFQRPDWLHYYAKFDWTSWTTCMANWWYNRNDNTFSFYNIPALSYFSNTATPDRELLRIKPDGTIVPRDSQYAHLTVILPTALRLCRDVVEKARPNMKYLKGRYYLRFGMWPKSERSQNFLIKDRVVLEKGVSVYHVEYDLDEDRWAIDPSVNIEAVSGTMQTLIYGNRPIFLVQGTEIEDEGADGEPLLHNVKLIKQLSKDEVYCPGIFDPREDDA